VISFYQDYVTYYQQLRWFNAYKKELNVIQKICKVNKGSFKEKKQSISLIINYKRVL
jgi:ABC-type uncharacterized transport system ATPase subunit